MFVLSSLKKLLGNSITKKITGIFVSDWSSNKYFHGCFASCSENTNYRNDIRNKYSKIHKNIYFAGEAHHIQDWATVSGAHQSGCQTAQIILNEIFGCKLSEITDVCYTNTSRFAERTTKYACRYLI